MLATLLEVLEERARTQAGDEIYTFIERAFSDTEQRRHLSPQQLKVRSQACAARLQAAGVKPGDRVFLLYPPGLELIEALFGSFYAGGVAVLLPLPRIKITDKPDTASQRLRAIYESAEPALVVTPPELAQQVQSALPTARILAEKGEESDAAHYRKVGVTAQSTALLQYTSGSTATPKGVQISHGNLIHNSAVIASVFGHDSNSRGVIWLPPYHDMGLIGGILQPLFVGFPVTLLPPTDFLMRPARWLQLISQTGATTSGGPNFAYDLCVKKISEEQKTELNLSSWRAAFCGAEPVRAATLRNFTESFAASGFSRSAWLPCYGLAEATLLVSGERKGGEPRLLDYGGRELVSCGSVPVGIEVRITDIETGHEAPEGHSGEICTRSSSVAQGYWNQPGESQQVFGEWLRTGDIGLLDGGELFVSGRQKDVLVIAGQNHHPEDIEHSIETVVEGVASCAAFAIDEESGEVLAITAEVSRTLEDEEALAKLDSLIRQTVTQRHDVRADRVLLLKAGTLPRTPSGKIQRHLCRQWMAENSWPENAVRYGLK